MASASPDSAMADVDPDALEEELEWEEWNGRGPFWHHMLAGSVAGVVEHVCMYPVDTFKTHLQALSSAPGSSGRPLTFADLLRRHGFLRLWRGSPAVMAGCIPSHAAYFSAYELGKERFGLNEPGHQPAAAALTGALATTLHDGVITPMDLVKQRLQLGYYRGVADCLRSVIRDEGVGALWRSYPTTLLMNMPYAAAVVAANESFKQVLIPVLGAGNMLTYMLCGAGAGAMAAAATCPLDVVKTRLQTAALLANPPPLCDGRPAGACASAAVLAGSPLPSGGSGSSSSSGGAASGVAAGAASARLGALDIAKGIWAREGLAGFFRGVRARMAVHTPSQAISWATYEAAKAALGRLSGGGGRMLQSRDDA